MIVPVEVKVEAAEVMSIYDMKQFQTLSNGEELKSLSEEDYEKFKENILENGIFVPFQIWRHKGDSYIIDGHQRWKTLKRMRGEGFDIPEVPVSIVEAETIEEAKQKLVYQQSQYGQLSDDNLKTLIEESNLEASKILENFTNPVIDTEKIMKDINDVIEKGNEVVKDFEKQEEKKKDKAKTSKGKIVHTCPECGYKFSSGDSNEA